ncbi:hypothetical protein, partial [Salmonella sp. SAL4456]|uniref:hypothetical protein n=1 Tax=Salmonella sp. SAL4456 TaxID=3159911 RepID=UPI00397A66B6
LRDLPPGERGPRLLFLAQLGRLARASITGHTAISASDASACQAGAGLSPQIGDDFRNAIAELDLSSFSLTA